MIQNISVSIAAVTLYLSLISSHASAQIVSPIVVDYEVFGYNSQTKEGKAESYFLDLVAINTASGETIRPLQVGEPLYFTEPGLYKITANIRKLCYSQEKTINITVDMQFIELEGSCE